MVALSASSLPYDILHELFCCFELTEPATKHNLGWVRATHVCKSWRDASLGFHSLWAHNVCVFPRQIETMMNRAAEAPIAICGHWRRRGISPDTVISLLQQEPSRIASLDFTALPKLDLFAALSGGTYVNLVDLRIVGELSPMNTKTVPMLAPKLERVSFHQGFVPIIAHRLRTLVLMQDPIEIGFHLSSILDVLESSPLLSKIHINGIINDLPASSARVVQLQNASDIELTGSNQPFMRHICIQYNNRDQPLHVTIGGSLSTFSDAISSIVRIVPTCHSLFLYDSSNVYTITFQDRMASITFDYEYDEDEEQEDTIRILQDDVARNIPFEHLCSLKLINSHFHHSLSPAFLAALSNVATLSSSVWANSVLDDLTVGVLPALRNVIQDSHAPINPLEAGLPRWEGLERFLGARAESGHPVQTLKLTGYAFRSDRGHIYSPTADRFSAHVTEVVDERTEQVASYARRSGAR